MTKQNGEWQYIVQCLKKNQRTVKGSKCDSKWKKPWVL